VTVSVVAVPVIWAGRLDCGNHRVPQCATHIGDHRTRERLREYGTQKVLRVIGEQSRRRAHEYFSIVRRIDDCNDSREQACRLSWSNTRDSR
jgi:hypothetical protein